MKKITFLLMSSCFTCCTLSFQNISTHGSATDLVDQEQDASPTVSTDLEVPKIPL